MRRWSPAHLPCPPRQHGPDPALASRAHPPLPCEQVDLREYGIAAHILHHLGVRSIRLLTSNVAKLNSMKAYGIAVTERVPLPLGGGGAAAAAAGEQQRKAAATPHGALQSRNGSEPHFACGVLPPRRRPTPSHG